MNHETNNTFPLLYEGRKLFSSKYKHFPFIYRVLSVCYYCQYFDVVNITFYIGKVDNELQRWCQKSVQHHVNYFNSSILTHEKLKSFILLTYFNKLWWKEIFDKTLEINYVAVGMVIGIACEGKKNEKE